MVITQICLLSLETKVLVHSLECLRITYRDTTVSEGNKKLNSLLGNSGSLNR